ncbi:protein-disulfide reductase DsbD domain-containing protein [Escherichia coli]|uniref:protein-disulfide reductase DsbD domain-containing protein n=1 Tax=Escherichia coli TaxID=562 RepID=UPI002433A9CD|nr:protein-disulfide reductase DsbD domain-containing protein [Escherichia coli]MDG5877722.1 protein-disulfide reductase DsbD family protein [Escherichia coli]
MEVRWRIADGYYLYRHRTSVKADAAFTGATMALPKGQGLPRRILRRRRNLPQGLARHPHRHARGRPRERDSP